MDRVVLPLPVPPVPSVLTPPLEVVAVVLPPDCLALLERESLLAFACCDDEVNVPVGWPVGEQIQCDSERKEKGMQGGEYMNRKSVKQRHGLAYSSSLS